MPTITPVDQPAHWMITELPDETGITRLGATTAVSESLTPIFAEGEQSFLDAVNASGDVSVPALPEAGTELEKGRVYDHEGTLLMVRQPHTRTEHDPLTVPALFLVYQPGDGVLDWVVGEQVYRGTLRAYDSQTYTCLMQHVTQADWTPPQVLGNLWDVYVPPGDTWVDSGETVVSLVGAGVIEVTDTAPFGVGQQIRIEGNEAEVTSIFTPGAPGILIINPHINVSGGEVIEILA